MAKETAAQKETVGRVMHEFRHGELTSGQGGRVRNPRQAVAIALSEAGASNRQSPRENRKRLAETKSRERRGRTAQAGSGAGSGAGSESGQTRAQLYAEAARKGIDGRSRMTKAELSRALRG